MSTKTDRDVIDRDVIAWARRSADIWEQKHGAAAGIVAQYRRLADLAEKGAEDWQPIASAPETVDGIVDPQDRPQGRMLVFDPEEGIVIAFRDGKWWYECSTENEVQPTHWRPLPAPSGGGR